ncbi:hypothetical protein RESH_03659 [Rhodopirellula europaea SH398]|uniref:Uncharacterized protein n=1 Tax=Rhodopirellula europaea SH398 TaxID=1263868 RepID=M5S295_9BACT|nr:hypothetical protein RESH_03659 [Rhodopirellula europaea SH398]
MRRPIEQIWLRSQLVKLSLNLWSLELLVLKPWLLGLPSLGRSSREVSELQPSGFAVDCEMNKRFASKRVLSNN